MKTLLTCLALSIVTAAATGCSGAPRDDEGVTSESASALTSKARLERSRIEVSGKNETHDGEGQCIVDRTHFHITYANETLPPGTKLTLHWGKTSYVQEYIGDGFGWSDAHKVWWDGAADVDMTTESTSNGDRFVADVDASGYGRMIRDWSQGWESWRGETNAPEIQFVFHVVMPNGREVWDNRLGQDYGATAGAACPANGNDVPLGSWGPF